MTKTITKTLCLAAGLASSLLGAASHAADAPALSGAAAPVASGSRFHVDAEVDPAGYLLDGYSLHLGIGWGHVRADLGVYAMALPKVVHGHDDLDVSFDGYGLKLQYFLRPEQTGGFVGVDAGVTRPTIRKRGTQLAERNTELGVGVNFGWRFTFAERFYATTWLGLGYGLNPHEVTVGGSTYEGSHLVVFPAVHLGYRFR